MDQNRWNDFSKREQLLTIGAEFMRANVWQQKSRQNFSLALERALELIDLTISDEKWKDNLSMLFVLRGIVAEFYIFKRQEDISFLYNAL